MTGRRSSTSGPNLRPRQTAATIAVTTSSSMTGVTQVGVSAASVPARSTSRSAADGWYQTTRSVLPSRAKASAALPFSARCALSKRGEASMIATCALPPEPETFANSSAACPSSFVKHVVAPSAGSKSTAASISPTPEKSYARQSPVDGSLTGWSKALSLNSPSAKSRSTFSSAVTNTVSAAFEASSRAFSIAASLGINGDDMTSVASSLLSRRRASSLPVAISTETPSASRIVESAFAPSGEALVGSSVARSFGPLPPSTTSAAAATTSSTLAPIQRNARFLRGGDELAVLTALARRVSEWIVMRAPRFWPAKFARRQRGLPGTWVHHRALRDSARRRTAEQR